MIGSKRILYLELVQKERGDGKTHIELNSTNLNRSKNRPLFKYLSEFYDIKEQQMVDINKIIRSSSMKIDKILGE